MLPYKGLGCEMTNAATGQRPSDDFGRRSACTDMELNAAECLEAYGVVKGATMCEKFFEDLDECKHGDTTAYRLKIMHSHRLKKLATGQLPWSQRWSSPYKYESFVSGTFLP